jgi:hypothetical protein
MAFKYKKLTDEEKQRFAPMLYDTWAAIAADAEAYSMESKLTRRVIIEMTCDANRPEMFGGMSKDEYARFSECYGHRDTQKWLRQVLNF